MKLDQTALLRATAGQSPRIAEANSEFKATKRHLRARDVAVVTQKLASNRGLEPREPMERSADCARCIASSKFEAGEAAYGCVMFDLSCQVCWVGWDGPPGEFKVRNRTRDLIP